jgi:hypothetical protein
MIKNSLQKQENNQSNNNYLHRRNLVCTVQIVEIRQVGGILHVTNVKNHYIK